MALTEFLLARIAEDETKAHDAAEASARAANGEHGGQGAYDDRMAWVALNRLGTSPQRVLAECEAKRRIVEWHNETPFDSPEANAGWWEALEHSFRALALPYADHPDFDPAWRVA